MSSIAEDDPAEWMYITEEEWFAGFRRNRQSILDELSRRDEENPLAITPVTTAPNDIASSITGTKPEICTEAENDEDDIPKLIEADVIADSRSVLVVKSRPDFAVESVQNDSISVLTLTCTKESFESPRGYREVRYAQKIFPLTNSMNTCIEQRDNFVDTGWNGSCEVFGMDAGKYLMKLENICIEAAICTAVAICTETGNDGGYPEDQKPDLSLEIKCHKIPRFRLFEKATLKDQLWLIDAVLRIATFHSKKGLITWIAMSLNLSPCDLFMLLYRWRWMGMAGRTIEALPLEMEQVEAPQGLLKSLSNVLQFYNCIGTNRLYSLINPGNRFDSLSLRCTFDFNSHVQSILTEFYLKTDYADIVGSVFHELKGEDHACYYYLISEHPKSGHSLAATKLFGEMGETTIASWNSILLCQHKRVLGANYRTIDIPISNYLHNKVSTIYVFTHFDSGLVNHHLSRAYASNMGGYNNEEFVEVLAIQQSPATPNWFQFTTAAVSQSLWLFMEPNVLEYLVLASDLLYRMEYEKFIQANKDTDADISVATLPKNQNHGIAFGLRKIDGEWKITEFSKTSKVDTSIIDLDDGIEKDTTDIASMGIYYKPASRLKLMFKPYKLLQYPVIQFYVYMKALPLPTNAKVADLATLSFLNIDSFLEGWSVEVPEQSTFFFTIADVPRNTKGSTKNSFKFLNKYLATPSGGDATTLGDAQAEAAKAIFEFLQIYLTERQNAYFTSQTANSTLLETHGINLDDCITKMRLIPLVALRSNGALPGADAASYFITLRDLVESERARFISIYKVAGPGGVILSVEELERQLLKREKENKMKRVELEITIKRFDADCFLVFEGHHHDVQKLIGKLLMEDKVKLLKGFPRNQIGQHITEQPAMTVVVKAIDHINARLSIIIEYQERVKCGPFAVTVQLPRWSDIYHLLKGIARVAICKVILQLTRAADNQTASRAAYGVLLVALHLPSLALDFCSLLKERNDLNQVHDPIPLLAFACDKDSVLEGGSHIFSILSMYLLKRFTELGISSENNLRKVAPEVIGTGRYCLPGSSEFMLRLWDIGHHRCVHSDAEAKDDERVLHQPANIWLLILEDKDFLEGKVMLQDFGLDIQCITSFIIWVNFINLLNLYVYVVGSSLSSGSLFWVKSVIYYVTRHIASLLG